MKKIVFGPFWMIYMLDYNLLVWSNFYFNSVNNLSIQDKKFQTHELFLIIIRLGIFS